jgi:hypothetical protein
MEKKKRPGRPVSRRRLTREERPATDTYLKAELEHTTLLLKTSTERLEQMCKLCDEQRLRIDGLSSNLDDVLLIVCSVFIQRALEELRNSGIAQAKSMLSNLNELMRNRSNL